MHLQLRKKVRITRYERFLVTDRLNLLTCLRGIIQNLSVFVFGMIQKSVRVSISIFTGTKTVIVMLSGPEGSGVREMRSRVTRGLMQA